MGVGGQELILLVFRRFKNSLHSDSKISNIFSNVLSLFRGGDNYNKIEKYKTKLNNRWIDNLDCGIII